MIGLIQEIGDQNEDQFCRDSLGESSDQEGHEVVPVPADIVHLIDEEDQIAFVVGELGLDPDHHLLEGNSFLVPLACVEHAGKVIKRPKTRPWI